VQRVGKSHRFFGLIVRWRCHRRNLIGWLFGCGTGGLKCFLSVCRRVHKFGRDRQGPLGQLGRSPEAPSSLFLLLRDTMSRCRRHPVQLHPRYLVGRTQPGWRCQVSQNGNATPVALLYCNFKPSLAPLPPLPVARFCSAASLLLRRSVTSHARASPALAPRLPDAGRGQRAALVRHEISRFPQQQGASPHARVYDRAGGPPGGHSQ